MITKLLIGFLVGLAIEVSAAEIKWEGTHRIVSSTQGRSSFNPQKCRTLCKLDVKDGKITGTVSPFGVNFRGSDWSSGERFSGTRQNQIIEWKNTRSGERPDKHKFTCTTVFHGVEDGDTLVGYFEQTWVEEGKKSITYCGVVDLKKAVQD